MSTEQQVNLALAQIVDVVEQAQVDPAQGDAVIAALSGAGHELRVWVDSANEFGHHSTTTNLLKRIIGYGYAAPVRVFCGLADSKKLELFLPGYTQGMAQLVYRGVTINFQYGGAPPVDEAPLLICGGSEAKPEELEGRLATANCRYYLQLQPWNWKSLDRLFYVPPGDGPTVTVTLDGQPSLAGADYSFCAYTEPTPARDNALWDLYGALPRFTARVAMAKLIDDAAAGKYVVPSYGLGSRSDKWSALVTLVLGSLAAQDQMSLRGLPMQPIVLLVCDSMSADDWPLLRGWLEGTTDDEDYPDELREFVLENKIAKRIGLQHTDDVKLLGEQLGMTVGNRVLVVGMPGCPDEIFRYFYARATVLPGVFEGRGTQNLLLNLGTRYLCTSPEGYPSAYFNAVTPPPAQRATAVVSQLQGLTSRYRQADTTRFPSALYGAALCDLLLDDDARDYFAALRASYGNPQRDKLRMALRYLRSVPGWTA